MVNFILDNCIKSSCMEVMRLTCIFCITFPKKFDQTRRKCYKNPIQEQSFFHWGAALNIWFCKSNYRPNILCNYSIFYCRMVKIGFWNSMQLTDTCPGSCVQKTLVVCWVYLSFYRGEIYHVNDHLIIPACITTHSTVVSRYYDVWYIENLLIMILFKYLANSLILNWIQR